MSLTLTGHDLTIAAVEQVAFGRMPVVAPPDVRTRISHARQIVERCSAQTVPIYGLNTGLGALKDVFIAPEEVGEFQRNILLSHAVGVGAEYPEPVVRAMLFIRLNGMARGGSGVQLAVFDTLLAMLNAGIHPVVRADGSLGMGEMAPMAQLALPLIGCGQVSYQGQRLSAAEAFARAGLAPVALGPKDAMGIINVNSVSLAQGALVLCEAWRLLECADLAAALSLEGFQGNTSPLDPRTHAARPLVGQAHAAARQRSLLRGSSLWRRSGRAVQDPLSYRCSAQVHGACADALSYTQTILETELNAAADTPLVLPDSGEMLVTGNFNLTGLALAFDMLAIAMGQLAGLATSRMLRLMSPQLTGLPSQLTTRPGVQVGFGMLQKIVSALNAQVSFNATPTSLSFVPVANGIEDHATHAQLGVARVEHSIATCWRILAIELLAAAQAVDLHGDLVLGAGTGTAYAVLRSVSPFLAADRYLPPEIDAIVELLTSGALQAAVAATEETLPDVMPLARAS
ncbi:MAG: histidine ammonia-lyase [Chloroflexales bacterium]|nr:histidine ammonia-lyase [Chloroflexales bacterium]